MDWTCRVALVFVLALPLTARAGISNREPGGASQGCGLSGAPIVPDPDLHMPVNPTIEQQIAAGKESLERIRNGDLNLDANQALVDYFNDLVKRLLAAQDIKPPYPIVVHVSTGPQLNAYASVGGHIVIYSRIFEQADNEAQLAAIVGHELPHEIHDDYVFFWNAAKNQEDSYGPSGLLEKSREIEMRADLDAARMMYGAGWDPAEEVKMLIRLDKMWRTQLDHHRIFYSTHPDDRERIDAVSNLITTLPPKPNLAKDSQTFRDLKSSL